jgi:site-specific DNA recombinase
MVSYLKQHPACRILLVEKTDRLYRNFKDYLTIDELGVDIHLVKENVILTEDSRSSEKFMHGTKVLMAKNYIDNLGEEVRRDSTPKQPKACIHRLRHSYISTAWIPTEGGSSCQTPSWDS